MSTDHPNRFPKKCPKPWEYCLAIPEKRYSIKKKKVQIRPRRPLTYRKVYNMIKYLPDFPKYNYLADLVLIKHKANAAKLPTDYYWAVMCLDLITTKVPRHVLVYWYAMQTYIVHAPHTQISSLKGTWEYMKAMHLVSSIEWGFDAALFLVGLFDKIGKNIIDTVKDYIKEETQPDKIVELAEREIVDLLEMLAEKQLEVP